MTDKQFIINQLRLDKIIYAVEATAVGVACLVGLILSSIFFKGVVQAAVIVILGFTCFLTVFAMGLGNWRRLRKIKQLEKQLNIGE